MQVNDSTDYTIYMLGNWHIIGKICIHVARYTSTTKLRTIQVIGIFGDNIPLFSRRFHSPLWIFHHNNIITCVWTDYWCFIYSCHNNSHSLPYVLVNRNFSMDRPGKIDFKYRFGELSYMKYVLHMLLTRYFGDNICYRNVSLPTIL